MNIHSVYLLASGQLTGQTVSVPQSELEANTPPGCGLIEGRWPPERWVVDLPSGQVVPSVEPKPADTADYMWSWSDDHGRWVASPTLERLRADKLAQIDQAIMAAEGGTDRALRELVLKSDLPRAALSRMRAIDEAVAALRVLRLQALSAQSAQEVEVVLLPLSA